MSTSDPTTRESSFDEGPSRSSRRVVGLSKDEALHWMSRASASRQGQSEMLELARRTRDLERPEKEIAFCGILQARLGGCAEDCAFCNQSLHHNALGGQPRELASVDEIVQRARVVKEMGARAFSIVTAGRDVSERADLAIICRSIERIATELGLETCASLGKTDGETFRRLVDAGLDRYHHNLEAAPSFFRHVITTYSIEESLETIALAHDAGLSICSSGVFGLGETDEQRVELVDLLRSLDVEGLPLCFLEPKPGTPLEGRPLLGPDEALRIVALHRLMMPTADVIVTGGRWAVFGRGQGAVLDAGANGVMVGDYPTSFAGELELDHRIVKERGFTLRRPAR